MACLHEMTETCYYPGGLTRLRPALESLQGNILRAHGRDHARHIFLRFVAGKQREVKRIHDLASTQITCPQRQIEEGARYRYGRTPRTSVRNFFVIHYRLPGSWCGRVPL